MYRLKYGLLLYTVILICNTPQLIAQELPKHIIKEYKLVWNEEFEGTELDLETWNHRGLETKRDISIVKTENSYLDGKGNCVIELTKVGEEYHIGQISTMLSYLTRYGYFECRARMNHEPGPHIAFWIQSPYISQGGSPDKIGAEIDVFEYLLKDPEKIYHTVHYGGYSEELHKKSGGSVKIDGIEKGFHTFGVEWLKDEYVFYVNGKETWRTREGVSNIAQYLILSIECCGWGGDVTKSKLPDEVVFDYVRVYKKK
ncbi:family 16 glycosylhydrolase [Bacteroidota bacterium]